MTKQNVWTKKTKVTLLALVGLLAVAFSITGGLLNMWHWPQVDFNPITYNAWTPIFNLVGNVLLFAAFYLGDVKNKIIWAIPVFWGIYNSVLIWMLWIN